jgi:hypothetical protein
MKFKCAVFIDEADVFFKSGYGFVRRTRDIIMFDSDDGRFY